MSDVVAGFDGLLAEMEDFWDGPDEGVIADRAAEMLDKSDKERSGVLSTVRRHTRWLDSKKMSAALSAHDLDLTELKTDPKGVTVFLCLPARRMGTHRGWLRLVVNQTISAMEEVRIKPATGVPTWLILEEAAVLGHMRQIEDSMGQLAGFGCQIISVWQDWNQVKALYKERAETFIANAGVLIAFGNNDPTTCELLSKRCGKTSFRAVRQSAGSQNSREGGDTGESWQTEVHDLLTAEEISRYFARERMRMLVIRPGRFPLALTRVNYFEDDRFEGAYDSWGDG